MFVHSIVDKQKSFGRQVNLFLVVLIVAGMGTWFLTFSHAASPYASINANNGTIAGGATSQACSGASDGYCVTFGYVVSASSRLYSTSSFWNTPIAAGASIDSNSSAIVNAAIVPYAASGNFSNNDSWGIPIAYTNGSSKVYSIGCTIYDCNTAVTSSVPAGTKANTGSDHHLAIINTTTGIETDMWGATYSASSDSWSASSRYQSSATGWGANCTLGQHCNGAVAAGFSLLGGAIFPWEIQQGAINHALFITTPDTRSSYIACPATHTDGQSTSTSSIPEGAHIQLNPSFDVAAQNWPSYEKIIAVALQKYGAYVGDTGGSLAIAGVSTINPLSPSWQSAGVPNDGSAYLGSLPWSQMQVLQVASCN